MGSSVFLSEKKIVDNSNKILAEKQLFFY